MPEAVTPEEGAVVDESTAIERISGLLEPDEGSPEAQEPETSQVTREEPEASQVEAEAEAEPETPEAEPEGEDEELPDTLEGFAELLGVTPEDFASHLKVNAKVKGEVGQVTLAEAINGYQREADYSRQTMELAEQRRGFETQAQQANERWQSDFERLNTAIEQAESLLGGGKSPEELAQLLEENPQEYLRVQAHDQARQQALSKAKEERDKMLQEAEQKHKDELVRYRVHQQQMLVTKLPELRDQGKLQKFESETSDYLRTQGFSEDEVGAFFGGAYDHRHVLILRDATKFRALQKGAKELPKKLKALPKVQKPGTARERAEGDKLVASRDRLRRLKTRGTKQQQTDAAMEYVKGLL